MQFEDTTRIDTPEGISLELPLAGLGSRFIAQFIDALVKGGALALVMIAVAALGGGGLAAQVVLTVGTFLSVFVYDIVFETLWSGRTIGKRATGLRVVLSDGGPIRFFASTVRNLLRIIDILPGVYGIGAILVVSTKRNQRIGDLAAGTLVVRDRSAAPLVDHTALPPRALPAGFDVTAIGDEHLALARQYLARRSSLAGEHRRRLAGEVAGVLRPLVGPTARGLDADELIESVVIAKDR